MISTENRRLRNPPWFFMSVLYMHVLPHSFSSQICFSILCYWFNDFGPPEKPREVVSQISSVINAWSISHGVDSAETQGFNASYSLSTPSSLSSAHPKRLPMGNLIILRVGGRAVNISITLPLFPLPSLWTTSLRSLQHGRGLCGGESPELTLPSS